MSHSDFGPYVEAKWRSYEINGKVGFVLKDKLKLLKLDLKK